MTGLGNYTRNVGYKTGAITYEFETKTFNYDRGIRLFADVNWRLAIASADQNARAFSIQTCQWARLLNARSVEEAGVNDYFVEAGMAFSGAADEEHPSHVAPSYGRNRAYGIVVSKLPTVKVTKSHSSAHIYILMTKHNATVAR